MLSKKSKLTNNDINKKPQQAISLFFLSLLFLNEKKTYKLTTTFNFYHNFSKHNLQKRTLVLFFVLILKNSKTPKKIQPIPLT